MGAWRPVQNATVLLISPLRASVASSEKWAELEFLVQRVVVRLGCVGAGKALRREPGTQQTVEVTVVDTVTVTHGTASSWKVHSSNPHDVN